MLEKIYALLQPNNKNSIDLAIQLARSQDMHKECYYLLRFGDMLDYLDSFEHIDVINYNITAPNFEEIAKVEKSIGKPLHKNVKNFYSQVGSMHLFWLDKRNKSYKSLLNAHITYLKSGLDGYIDIKTINEIYYKNQLYTADRNGIALMDERIGSREVPLLFHSFDDFSVYNDVVAYKGRGFEDNPLLMIGQQQKSYTDSYLMHIPSYLELVFHYCGSLEARARILRKKDGHLLPILEYDQAYFEQFKGPDFNKYPAILDTPASNFRS